MAFYYERMNPPDWFGPRGYIAECRNELLDMHTILDAGCGNGDLLESLYGAKWNGKYTGVDCVPANLVKAWKRFQGVEWILGDFTRVDFGRTFDAVVALCPFTGQGWESEEIGPAIRRLLDLSTKRFLICYNAYDKEIHAVLDRYATWKDETSHVLVRIDK